MDGIYGINYDGVKKRPTFEELIDYKEPKITYPDRSALFTRESPLMTQFDNIGAMESQKPTKKKNARNNGGRHDQRNCFLVCVYSTRTKSNEHAK